MLVALRKRVYSALVTCVAASKKASTQTRWTGRSQSWPAVEPIRNHAAGISTNNGSSARAEVFEMARVSVIEVAGFSSTDIKFTSGRWREEVQ